MGNYEKYKEYQKQYRLKNKDKKISYNEKYYINNKEKFRLSALKYGRTKKGKEYKKEYFNKNKERIRNNTLKNKFSITLVQYNEMFEKQGGLCAICKQKQEQISLRYKNLAVDHNHKTGKIRGLLCSKCNKAIGLLNDDFSIVEAALNYLREEYSLYSAN
jgi:hypothetical protein